MHYSDNDRLRIWLTFIIAVAGIVAALLALLVAILVFRNHSNAANTIVAVVGPVTAVIGTLAGYVAGQTAGSAGRDRAERRASDAQEQAATAERQLSAVTAAGTAMSGEDVVARARQLFPKWFPDEES